MGAALFMLVSKYGFNDVLAPGRVVLDPSRVAAQIVTGIGFLGAGLIFVRGGSVRGLTTAATVWVTAAVGAAAGAGALALAGAATAMYFLVALVFPLVSRRLPRSASAISVLRARYPAGRGVLVQLLEVATAHGFVIDQVSTTGSARGVLPASNEPEGQPAGALRPGQPARAPRSGQPGGALRPGQPAGAPRSVEVTLHVRGRGSVNDLAGALSELDDVDAVVAGDVEAQEA
jgi:putative Mg2+ transporter-C (MgtC) family protein